MRTITYDDYLKLFGLIALARECRQRLTEIEDTACKLLGDHPSGHTSDVIWGGMDHSPTKLLSLLGISVAVEADPN
jgi:hypothetical protein